MDIMISENLRGLRKRRGKKQEEVAEYLSVSPQAVSKWERCEAMPDISLLPKIAAFYGVTVDDLLGVGEIQRQEKLKEYERKSKEFSNKGLVEENEANWREAYKEFPYEMQVLAGLSHALWAAHTKSESGSADERVREIIVLCDRILKESTDQVYRDTAIQLSCFAYKELGDNNTALTYANMAASIWCCAEALKSQIFEGDKLADFNKGLLLTHLDMIGNSLLTLCRNQDYEQYIWLHEFYLKLLDMFFDDGFYGFYAYHALYRHYWLARIYTACRNDEAKAQEHLEAMRKMAEQYDGLSEKYEYTSTLLRGVERDMSNTYKNFAFTQVESVLGMLADEVFDCWREKDWFIVLEKNLRGQAQK